MRPLILALLLLLLLLLLATGCVSSTTNVNVVTGHGRLEAARPSTIPKVTPYYYPLIQDPGF